MSSVRTKGKRNGNDSKSKRKDEVERASPWDRPVVGRASSSPTPTEDMASAEVPSPLRMAQEVAAQGQKLQRTEHALDSEGLFALLEASNNSFKTECKWNCDGCKTGSKCFFDGAHVFPPPFGSPKGKKKAEVRKPATPSGRDGRISFPTQAVLASAVSQELEDQHSDADDALEAMEVSKCYICGEGREGGCSWETSTSGTGLLFIHHRGNIVAVLRPGNIVV